MRLLLVDDDAGFRELLRTTFEDVQVEVDEAGSAAEAERRISASRPDVIVLDVGMPGMDGLAFCRELKSAEDTRGDPRRPPHRDGRRGGRGRRRRRGCAAVEAVPATRAARRRRAPGGGRRGGADAPQQRPLGRGAARPLRPRPASPRRDRARAARLARERLQGDRVGSRERTRDEGHGHTPALAARAAVRARARARDRPGARRRIPHWSTDSSSTTSARSACPTRSCSSRSS